MVVGFDNEDHQNQERTRIDGAIAIRLAVLLSCGADRRYLKIAIVAYARFVAKQCMHVFIVVIIISEFMTVL